MKLTESLLRLGEALAEIGCKGNVRITLQARDWRRVEDDYERAFTLLPRSDPPHGATMLCVYTAVGRIDIVADEQP